MYGGAPVLPPETGALVQRKTDLEAAAPEQRQQDQFVRDEVGFGFVQPQPYIDANGADPVQRRASTTTIDAPRADSISADRATIGATPAGVPAEQRPELDASKADSLREDRGTIAPEAAPGPLAPDRVARATSKNSRLVSRHGIRPADLGTDAAPDSAAFAQAVAQFQAEHGLAIDGIVGPKIAAAVRGSAGPAVGTVGGSAPAVGDDPDARGTGSALLQMKAGHDAAADADVHRAAAAGTAGSGQPLPHLGTIQEAFGGHDVTNVTAHVGGAAADAADAMGAVAYATGHDVAFGEQPDLHTAAHEAAHVVQQRGGVQLKGGVGQAGDSYEQHSDAVADKVVRGDSAESILDEMAPRAAASRTAGTEARGPHSNGPPGYAQQPAVQRKGGDEQPAPARGAGPLAPQLVIGLGDASVMFRGFPVKISGAVTIARTTGPSSEGPLAAEWFKPQIDVFKQSLASTLFTGVAKGKLNQFPGVSVEGALKGLSGKQSGKGAASWSMDAADLPSISFLSAGVSFKGDLPELLDGLSPDAQRALAGGSIPAGGLGSIVKVTVSGTISVDLVTADQAAAKAAEETAEAAAKHQAAHAAKVAELQRVNAQHAVARAERAVFENELNVLKRRPPVAPVGESARETFEHMQASRAYNERTHQLEKQLEKAAARESQLAARMTTLGGEAAEEMRGYQRHLAKLKNLKNKATGTLAKWIAKFAQTSLGKVVLKAFAAIAILGGVVDVAILLVDLVHIAANLDSLRFEFLGGGPTGPGGQDDEANAPEGGEDGSGRDPTQEGEGDGEGGDVDHRGPEGRGGAGTGGGTGDGRERAGRGADGSGSAERGGGQRAPTSSGTSERPGTESGRGGASRSREVELSLEARMVLAQSGVGKQALDDDVRRRLNRIVASLTDAERDRLFDVLGSWKPGNGGEMLADLERAIAGLRATEPAPGGTSGGNQTSRGQGKAEEGGGSRSPGRKQRRDPGQGGDESGAGSKHEKRNPLRRDQAFPISYELIQHVMDPLLDTSGQLTVSPKEAEQAIVARAGELLEGKVQKGPRGLAMFLDVDGATAPRNVATAGEPPRWEFHLLLLVEVGGKRTTDFHMLSYEPTMSRGQAAHEVDFSAVVAQFALEGGRIGLKEVGAVVPIGRWKGKLLRVRWQDGRPGGKAEVQVKPVGKIREGERLGRQEVRKGDAIWIVVGG